MTTQRKIVRRLQCVGPVPHVWNAILEYDSDLTMSHLTDRGDKADGYAIIKDKSFVRCPHCDAYNVILPGLVAIEVTKVK